MIKFGSENGMDSDGQSWTVLSHSFSIRVAVASLLLRLAARCCVLSRLWRTRCKTSSLPSSFGPMWRFQRICARWNMLKLISWLEDKDSGQVTDILDVEWCRVCVMNHGWNLKVDILFLWKFVMFNLFNLFCDVFLFFIYIYIIYIYICFCFETEARRRAEVLSGGNKRKLSAALALVRRPSRILQTPDCTDSTVPLNLRLAVSAVSATTFRHFFGLTQA